MEHHGVICTGMTEHCLQFWRQALRNNYWQSGMYANTAYVVYFVNGGYQVGECSILKHQRVATTEYDF